MVYRRCAVLLLLVLMFAPTRALGQDGADTAAAEVRALVRALDPHSAYRVGQEPIRQYPDSAQLRAWWLVAGARAGREAESLEAARTFAESEPEEWAAGYRLLKADKSGPFEGAGTSGRASTDDVL